MTQKRKVDPPFKNIEELKAVIKERKYSRKMHGWLEKRLKEVINKEYNAEVQHEQYSALSQHRILYIIWLHIT